MKTGLIILTLTLSSQLMASTPKECKTELSKSRKFMVEMSSGKADEAQAAGAKAAAKKTSECLMSLKAPAGKEAQLAEIQKIWGEIRTTKEKEVIPLMQAGKIDEAKAIITGVQSDRVIRINSLLNEVGE